MGNIVLEDFNEGNGYYKINLAYLNKEQVEEIEALVSKWKPTDEDIKSCIAMCLTDANEQRFKDYGTNLKNMLDWLEKQGESDETKAKTFLINKGYPIDTNSVFPTYEEMYNIIREGLEKQGNIDKASYEIAEKEKCDFVNGQFIECRKSFDEFKEYNSYWFEYVGNDTYIGRSDNILNKKFHITPRQLYRLFTQEHYCYYPKENNEFEKQMDKGSQVKLPIFTFDDVLALQCCMETVKKVQEDKDLYEKLKCLHGRVYDAYYLEKQGKSKFEQCTQDGDKIVTNEDGTHFNISQLERTVKKVTESKEAVKEFLKKAGIMDKNGELAEEYRLEKQGEKEEPQVYETEDGEVITYSESEGYKAVEPKFKVGDIIRHKKQGFTCRITAIDTEYRVSDCCGTHLPFDCQDYYELVAENPAWSEEDERMCNASIRACKCVIDNFENSTLVFVNAINWLKSLKDRFQSHWKPSEEQMKGIDCAIKTLRHQLNVEDKRLNSLYKQLKKL